MTTNESFEEYCIRTGHKPFGAQGINASEYHYDNEGRVQRGGFLSTEGKIIITK